MKKKGVRREVHTTPPPQGLRVEPSAPSNTGARSHARGGDWLDSLASLWDGRTAAFVLGVKALVFAFAAQAYVVVKNERLEFPTGWLSIWNRWDAPHYLDIARMGYVKEGVESRWIVFYPLYPWLVRAFSLFVRDEFAAALLVSTLASVAAALLLYKLARLDGESEWVARAAVFFMFVFPTSYFLHIGYTESLFLALALGTFVAARTRRWPLAGLLGVLACMARANGLALLPALAFEVWAEYRDDGRVRARWLWALLPAAGFGVYLLINWGVHGHPFAFIKMQDDYWARSFAWPWDGIAATWKTTWNGTPSDALMVGWQEFFFASLGLGVILWAWLRMRASYAVWMTCNWLLWSCTKFVLSVPRYTLVLFPAYIIFARASARRPVAGALIAVWSLLFLALFLMRFSQGYWAF